MAKDVSACKIDAAQNTAAVATISNSHNIVIEGHSAHWSYSAAPTGGKLTVKSGTTPIDEFDIILGGPGFMPLEGYNSVKGQDLSVTLAAGGGTVVGKVSMSARI